MSETCRGAAWPAAMTAASTRSRSKQHEGELQPLALRDSASPGYATIASRAVAACRPLAPVATRCIVCSCRCIVVQHPLVHDALATLRDATTPPELFRRMAIRISLLLAAEATRDVPVGGRHRRRRRSGRRTAAGSRRDVVVVPVLRAGLGMLDAVLELIPGARVGHIGLQRDELTAVASQYYSKLPRGSGRQLRADDRSDAGHRRQRRRRARPAAAARAPATSA